MYSVSSAMSMTKFEVDDVVAVELGFCLMLKAILGAPFIAIFVISSDYLQLVNGLFD